MATTIRYQGTPIHLTSKRQGVAYPWGGRYQKEHYRVFITIEGKRVQFEYYTPSHLMTRDELISALHCFLLDVYAYDANTDLRDFAKEFGYDVESKECRTAWRGCRHAYEKWLGIKNCIEYNRLINWLQENFRV